MKLTWVIYESITDFRITQFVAEYGPRMKITVIGAGLAGLTAAHRLQQAGFSVNVLERAQSPGGRMAEAHDLGLDYLTGARLIYSFSKSVMGLIRELDLTDQLCHGLTIPVSTCSLAGEHPVQISPGPRLLFNSPLSCGQRWRLLQMAAGMAGRRFSTNPDRLLDWQHYDEGTLYEFLKQRSLDQASKIYIEPIFRGARGWRMTDVSPVFFLSTAAHMYGAHAYTFDGGIGVLTERLAQTLDVTYCADVKNVSRSATGGSELSYELNGLLYSTFADLVICAVPGSLSLRMVSQPTPEESQFFRCIKYNSGYVVHFGIDRSVEPYVRFFSRDVSTSIAGVEIVDQSTIPSSYLSRLSVYLSPEAVIERKSQPVIEGELPPIWNDLPDDVARQLDRGYGHVVQQKIENMLPLFYPGYLKELSVFETYQTSGKKQIYYAGDYMSHALLGGACRSGEDVAQAIILDWAD
jgi:oxygen-dependent protoporphyrinogen oxidase